MRSKPSVFTVVIFLALIGTTLFLHVAKGQEAAATGAAATRKPKTKVSPEYPALARQMNVSGKVKLEVTIAADGHVVSARTIGGSPLLVGAATDAVKKWRYEPGAKESTEIVEFNFSN
jgi:TonB family protein